MSTRTITLEEQDTMEAIAERARTYLVDVTDDWKAHVVVRKRKGAVVHFTEPEDSNGSDVGVGGSDAGGTSSVVVD